MKLKDLPEYCKSKDKCSSCEYIRACDKYFDGCIIHDVDPSKWYDYIDWNTEIRKDTEE